MITCEQAAIICDKAQYREASLLESVKLWFHLITCRICSQYSKKNEKLTTLCQQARLHGFSGEEKQQLKQQLKKNI